jgi:hypothetical protein
MPAGNGDLGINAWINKSGDLMLYIGKTDAWSAHHRLLKLGCLRISFTPALWCDGQQLRQELVLRDGIILITAGSFSVRIWVDAFSPVIRIETENPIAFQVRVALELWRTAERTIVGRELFSAYGQRGENPRSIVETPDQVISPTDMCPWLGWYHRNKDSIWRANHSLQGMEVWAETQADPLLHRTFGCRVAGEGLIARSKECIESNRARTRCLLTIVACTAQTATADEWLRQCDDLLQKALQDNVQESFARHSEWWNNFWKRSWIHIEGGIGDETFTLSQTWHLQRYVVACAGRGSYPVKFNGSIFNVDTPCYFPDGGDADPDYRDWGGAYWLQNQRQIFWPLLTSGDFDLIQPFFKLYVDALPYARARTRRWFGHGGAFFPETFYFWGAYTDENYGYNRTSRPIDFVDNHYVKRHWQGNLEIIAMALDYYAAIGSESFANCTLVPLAEAIVGFYDEHYPRQAGKLRMAPAQALETLWDVVNPAPDLAGLHYILPRIAVLRPAPLSLRQRARRLLEELPDLPIIKRNDGTAILAPAEEVLGDEICNAESVALWSVFPYRQFGLGKRNIALAKATFHHRIHRGYFCWQNDNVFAAWLGLASEARRNLYNRCRLNQCGKTSSSDSSSNRFFRFPVFFGGGDWTPDHDNGGVIQQTLQAMLIQENDKVIRLFPAWPKEWNVSFRLHASQGTVVEATFRDGKTRHISVYPKKRSHAVRLCRAQ